jgi:hypothetical protein
MSNAIIPIGEIERMAVAVAKSGLFGIKSPEQAIALMLIAQAEGMHPAIAARDYHIIQGRPSLKSDAMLARFQAAGGKVVWNEYSDKNVSGTFTHPAGGSATVAWSIDQAKAAGLTGKDVWKQYPRAMLRARVISEGIRTVYPGVSVGVYTPEEIEDFNEKPAAKEVKAEVQVADSKESVVEVFESEKPKQSVINRDDRKALMSRIAKIVDAGQWNYSQLKTYVHAAFGVEESSKLTIEQLSLVASVCENSNFSQAIEEIEVKSAAGT